MGFNRFNITVVILCLLIAFSSIVLVEVWTNNDFKIAKLTVSIVWLLLIYALIKYVNKTNRSLKQFLENLKYSDYITSGSDYGKSFKELNLSLNEITRYVRIAELEKESTHQYLRQILDQMPSGIIAANNTGNVEIINRAGLDIFEISTLNKISQLDQLQQGLANEIIDLPKHNKKVISVKTSSGLKTILFKIKQIKINDRLVQIISFENIKTELDLEEERAWQKIFRVLTHEIMNSIGPIRSLTASVLKIFINENQPKTTEELNNEDIGFAVTGLQSIDNRNVGLSNFVADFKKLMRIPEPKLEQVELNSFIDNVFPLLKELSETKNVDLKYNRLLEKCFVKIDKQQITQVLINIIKNAVEAINSEKGKIELKSEINKNQLRLLITDNGIGIPDNLLPEIFIPFFTTKKEGSGIGLSISRQIIRNHKGELRISSQEKNLPAGRQGGTRCELIFPINN